MINASSITNRIQESIALQELLLKDEQVAKDLARVIDLLVDKFKQGQGLYLCGNGGSAADASHLAAEFSGRFYLNRKALPAETLSVNMAAVTAISNDFGFESLFARMLESKGKEGDVLWVLSTSGSSKNIIEVAKQAGEMGIAVVSFTGQKLSELDSLAAISVKIPSIDTPRIQECHMLLGHIICEQVEKQLFNE